MRMLLAPLMVVLVAANAWAGDGSRGFSNSDITGNYSWLAQGSAMDPGTHIAFPVVVIGTVFSDGQGNMQGTGTVNLGRPGSGLTPGQKVALSLTYEVEEDGTGQWSAAVNPDEPPSLLGSGAMVIGANDEVQLVSTQPDRVDVHHGQRSRIPVRGLLECHAWRRVGVHVPRGARHGDGGCPYAGDRARRRDWPDDQRRPRHVLGSGDGQYKRRRHARGLHGGEPVSVATAWSAQRRPVLSPLLANLSGVVDNRHEFRVITTDPGRIVSCAFKAQGRPDEGRDKRRRHAR